MNEAKAVVITGCGVLSPYGDLSATWDVLLRGEARVSRREREAVVGFPFGRGYSIESFDASEYGIPRKEVRAMGDAMCYAAAAATMAIRDAALADAPTVLAQAALLVAARYGERDDALDASIRASIGHHGNYDGELNELLLRGLRPGLFLAQLPNLFAGNISLLHQVRGPSMTFVGEHGASGRALEEAVELVRDGTASVVIAGGCYQAGDYLAHYLLASSGILSPDLGPDDTRAVVPWSQSSDGTVPGTGAAFLVFEALEHALARGVTPRARVRAIGCSTDVRSRIGVADALDALYCDAAGAERSARAFIGHGCGVRSTDVGELEFLQHVRDKGYAVSAVTTPAASLGESVHAAFPTRVALAVTALARDELFGFPIPVGEDPALARLPLVSRAQPLSVDSICAVSVGAHEGECLAILDRYAA